jgi:tRNA U38,U39,U40 pseudouridine synthase TruA
MQRQEQQFPTVEMHLLNAMLQHGFITEEHKSDLYPWHFQRAARTDRSVSAVRQVFLTTGFTF